MTIVALFVGGPLHSESRYLDNLNGGEYVVQRVTPAFTRLVMPSEVPDDDTDTRFLLEKVPTQHGTYARINPHVVRQQSPDESTRKGDDDARRALSHLWSMHRQSGRVTLFWMGWDE